jgi:putative hydrolase
MLNTKEDCHIHCNYNNHSSPDLTVSNVVKYAENIGLRVILLPSMLEKHQIGFLDILTKYDVLAATGTALSK